MQPKGFERISHNNQVLPCEALPAVDLTLWKDGQNSGGGGGGGGSGGSSYPDSSFDFSSGFFFKK